jgi:hypothetical protein
MIISEWEPVILSKLAALWLQVIEMRRSADSRAEFPGGFDGGSELIQRAYARTVCVANLAGAVAVHVAALDDPSDAVGGHRVSHDS